VQNNFNFVPPLSFSTSLAGELVTQTSKTLTAPRNGFTYCNRTYFHAKSKVSLAGETVWARVYHDEERKAAELLDLYRKKDQVKKVFDTMKNEMAEINFLFSLSQ